jgi:hypothetical protein
VNLRSAQYAGPNAIEGRIPVSLPFFVAGVPIILRRDGNVARKLWPPVADSYVTLRSEKRRR